VLRAFLVLLVVTWPGLPQVLAQQRLADIEAALRVTPGNLDLRMKLAQRLAGAGRYPVAQKQARKILEQAPNHWDAHLLLARIDGWQGRYDAALTRIKKVRAAVPYNMDALVLWADVATWGGRGYEARRALATIKKLRGPSASLYHRHAALHHTELDHYSAKRYNKLALALDQKHEPALRLNDDLRVLSAEAVFDTEFFPVDEPGKALAHGVTLSVTALPRARLSLTATYEYRYRFATNNHRMGIRGDLRINPKLTVWAAARAGLVEVVPELVAQVGADYAWSKRYTLSFQYRADKMTWPGTLHRLQTKLAIALPRQFSAGAQLEVGALRNCGDTTLIQGVGVSGGWAPKPWALSLGYFFGAEAERPVSPGLVMGDSPCPTENSPLDSNAFRLIHTQSHTITARLQRALSKDTILTGGYALQSRFTGDLVHGIVVGIRRWF